MSDAPAEIAVLDASVLVDLLAGTGYAPAAKKRLAGTVLPAPAHLDAEVLSSLSRLERVGQLPASEVGAALGALATISLTRHPVVELAAGAWARRADLRLADALYVELAGRLHARVLAADHRLARATSLAEGISRWPRPGVGRVTCCGPGVVVVRC
ncbi:MULTISPECIES: type II toxin-antitoxin system VapC family toxin [Amycolatopsis]|uniref:type II toxin-antitoxin system VapC family toxin n=1 Tax=Amycolatopsis TaxID=1813 RepID=UPI000B8B1B29|nr:MULTISPECIES: type II toxin-antitoxin system VapC family toxin [Amycolatopsis]OXM75342.1 VapC toxin family PIN domain ribonuclease [Amycolatopsis sp. KNN50.9b]